MMKKYLKCVKKLQLVKSIFIGSIFIICSSYALASDSNLHFLTGTVNTIKTDGRDCSISVTSREQQSWMYTDKKNICDFLQRAKDFEEKINFEYTLGNGYENIKTRNKLKGVNFAGTNSKWLQGEKLPEINVIGYALEGTIENVYSDKDDFCYIAINISNNVNNIFNKKFHKAKDNKICNLAQDAYHLGLRVIVNAAVDDKNNIIGKLFIVNGCN